MVPELYDYIYTDTDKVISVYSQLTGGVVELRETLSGNVTTQDKNWNLDVKVLKHDRGSESQDKKELKETVNFIINSPFERMQICIYNPIPGSESFNKIFEKYDPEKFNINIKRYLYEGYIPNFLKYLDISTIKKYNSYTYYRFYSKLPIFLSLIRNITFRQILDILRNPTFQKIFISTK